MNPVRPILRAAAVVFGGCALLPPLRAAAALVVTQEDSRFGALCPPTLVVSGDQLLFSGSVRRQFGTRMTAKSHVNGAFFTAARRELRAEATAFYPHK